ncbi:hypothetical protein [Acetobacter fallax]|uniref:Uncharacterized protein n=1 Tax=Acetobacter fallax TaxID=1737473 RepID=A0ABX0KCP5_9PROT|nr:hypothetical protein [Acetobacter fallax]NHO32901.1 hypothetical protein [Acetobacter fallax]NHO36463.1 hypothetical protein [Acetobacter fallax]
MRFPFEPVAAAIMLSSTIFSATAAPAAAAQVTGTYDNPTVPVYGTDYSKHGQLSATSLVGHPIIGRDNKSGMLKVQTDQGVVLVRAAAVQTNLTAAPPAETSCVQIISGSVDESANSTNNLGSSCSGR